MAAWQHSASISTSHSKWNPCFEEACILQFASDPTQPCRPFSSLLHSFVLHICVLNPPPTPAPWAYKLATLALKIPEKTSLVVQWTRIHLPMQGTRVRPLVFEYPTCHGATKPMSHNYWACALEPVHHNH